MRRERGSDMSVKNGTKTGGKDSKGRFVAGNKLGKGRPKKDLCASDLIRAKGDSIAEDGRSELQIIIDKLYQKAKGGDLRAIEMIFDRLEGKPTQMANVNFNNPVSSVQLVESKDV